MESYKLNLNEMQLSTIEKTIESRAVIDDE